jgi:hypothetical protein
MMHGNTNVKKNNYAMLQPLTNFAHGTLSSSSINQNLSLYLTAYNYGGQFLLPWSNTPQWATAFSLSRLYDHTQTHYPR